MNNVQDIAFTGKEKTVVAAMASAAIFSFSVD